MTKLFALLTIALAASACTIYLGDDDGDHGGWIGDAQRPPGDATPYPDGDGLIWPDAAPWPPADAMPIPSDGGVPWADAAPVPTDGHCGP